MKIQSIGISLIYILLGVMIFQAFLFGKNHLPLFAGGTEFEKESAQSQEEPLNKWSIPPFDGEKFRYSSLASLEQVRLLKEWAKAYGYERARQFLRDVYSDEPADDHELIHVIGEAAFLKLGYGAFNICDSFFKFGCYHGVVLEAIRQSGYNQKLLEELADGCLSLPHSGTTTTACIHGIGHAIMVVRGYDLIPSYEDCDRMSLDKLASFYCYDGVSMENVVRRHEREGALDQLYSEDPYYPCNSVPQQYEAACVREHIFHVRNNFGWKDVDKSAEYCLYFTAEDTLRECFGAMGSAINQDFSSEPKRVIEECNKLVTYDPTYRTLCTSTAATHYSFAQQSQQAEMLCNSLPDRIDREGCFGAVEYARASLF
ncbi:hypothetical protein IH982_02120 [Patescibacteria group bacterium]|nr:hypothetical protein [Patescibacteria group bacterium]